LKDESSNPKLEIDIAPVFRPLLVPSRYKAAYGGRGSGKSQFFADLAIARCINTPGFRLLACREIQKSLKDSAKFLMESKIKQRGLSDFFDIKSTEIGTPGGGLITFVGLQDHTSESIKSYEGYDAAWIEEAHGVSKRSNNLLRPTIRKENSELWYSWNPRFDFDAVDEMFRGAKGPPTGSIVVKANWSDNPWFPPTLEQERLDCIQQQPEQYDHIWEGGYASVMEGAYYAKNIALTKEQDRIRDLSEDPVKALRAYWDIGLRDACAIWIVQQHGNEMHFLDYYEAEGQDLAYHLDWMRSAGWGRAEIVLPHDGAKRDSVMAMRYEDHIREAGFRVRTIPNQGRGAAMKRIEAARRLFGNMHFDKTKCASGLKALGQYHERINQAGYGVGPEHDWSSHGADAFGLAAIDYQEPRVRKKGEDRAPAGAMGWLM